MSSPNPGGQAKPTPWPQGRAGGFCVAVNPPARTWIVVVALVVAIFVIATVLLLRPAHAGHLRLHGWVFGVPWSVVIPGDYGFCSRRSADLAWCLDGQSRGPVYVPPQLYQPPSQPPPVLAQPQEQAGPGPLTRDQEREYIRNRMEDFCHRYPRDGACRKPQ